MSDGCTQVSAQCPVEATTLGYYPNKPLNIFLAAAFGLAAVLSLAFGLRGRTWSYAGFLAAGCALELAGYAGRALLAANPWAVGPFELQICAIILAPTLVCAAIYITLKHVCLALAPGLSRVRPARLPFLFVPADVSCLVVQAIGGSLAVQGARDLALLRAGDRTIIAGIALQVVVLLAFGATCLDYYVRVRRWLRGPEGTPEARALWADKRFRMFVCAVLGAYVCVQIRCIYRVAEMAGGWGNYIMQDQPSFVVLDSFMMLINVYLLACFPPSIFFPQMAKGGRISHPADEELRTAQASDEGHDSEQGGLKTEKFAKEPVLGSVR